MDIKKIDSEVNKLFELKKKYNIVLLASTDYKTGLQRLFVRLKNIYFSFPAR